MTLQHNLDAAREAYDAFLARYPYCYGYWKKYADMEKKHDNFDEAEEVTYGLIKSRQQRHVGNYTVCTRFRQRYHNATLICLISTVAGLKITLLAADFLRDFWPLLEF